MAAGLVRGGGEGKFDEACKTRTVAELMRERRVERLDYVSVDVEGAELEVLRSVDWAATPADVVQVESVEGAAKNDTAALVALMARWYHLDIKYDVSPPPCRPGEVTADCTYDLIFVSRRFARDLRARLVLATLSDNDFFGETSLVSHDKTNASIRSESYSDMNVLLRSDFLRIVELFLRLLF